ncbi:MAG: hypothetical protein QNJ41_11975 [Xenococcaceae cyanobacterium MO_188.B32]|nr:hypothetical protein [Xenococcaceae cyanobacterium MO_188.B32]
MDNFKAELKKLIRSQQPKFFAELSDASRGYGYVRIEKKGQSIDVPILNQITTNSSISL